MQIDFLVTYLANFLPLYPPKAQVSPPSPTPLHSLGRYSLSMTRRTHLNDVRPASPLPCLPQITIPIPTITINVIGWCMLRRMLMMMMMMSPSPRMASQAKFSNRTTTRQLVFFESNEKMYLTGFINLAFTVRLCKMRAQ